MNKTELVAAMAEQAGLSKKDAEAALKAFTDVVASELKANGKVQLVGFGTFEVLLWESVLLFVSLLLLLLADSVPDVLELESTELSETVCTVSSSREIAIVALFSVTRIY